MPDFIKLPTERVEQLRILAKNRSMTIADCIGEYVNEQIAKGNLTSTIPGLEVEPVAATSTVKLKVVDDFVSMTKQDAERLSKSLRLLLTPSKHNPFLPIPDLDIARKGKSFKIKDTLTGAEKTIAPSIASELADQLEKVAKS